MASPFPDLVCQLLLRDILQPQIYPAMLCAAGNKLSTRKGFMRDLRDVVSELMTPGWQVLSAWADCNY